MTKREPPAAPPTRGRGVSRACDVVVGLAVVGYVALFSVRTISAYTSGTSLFDLATYAQGFWNALGDPPFFYSLEGEMSRFGRHFSPFFYLLLPFYLLHPDPSTLLALQALLIGLGALPLYWLAAKRLGKPFGAAFVLAYVLNPAVHDINIQNDFHEIAFALPTLLLAFYLGQRGRPLPYALALVAALATREEVALTTALFGLYLAIEPGRRRLGLATVAASVAWFALVAGVAMPAFNAGARFPMPDGYAYLGDSPVEVARGILSHPGEALSEILRRPKVEYVFWLLAPVAFLPLVAPEALAVAGLALLEVLVSTYSYHFRVFERYAAPIVPVVFFAAVLGAARLQRWLPSGRAWSALPVAVLLFATVASQLALRKLPTYINFAPDAHGALALQIARAVPPQASVAAEDHRLLPHLAHRRLLYFLSPTSPPADYVLFDRGRRPITVVPPEDQARVQARYLGDPAYQLVRCEEGIYLLGRQETVARDGPLFPDEASAGPPLATFGGVARLSVVTIENEEARPGGSLAVELRWEALSRVGADYQVFTHLVDGAGRLRAQHDGAPHEALCPTSLWAPGLVVRDRHVLPLPGDLPPGRYELRIGLYDLGTLGRLPRAGAGRQGPADYYATTLEIRP